MHSTQRLNTEGVRTIRTPRHKALVALLIEARLKRGLRQEDVAKALGEHQSWVARLESGQRRIDVVEFLVLADILKFDAAKVLTKVSKAR